MTTPLPPLDVIKHLLERLKANDIAWFRERYKAGDLAWLKDRLPAGGYEKLGERIEAGDLGWLRERIGGLPGMNIPGLDLGGLGKAGAAVGNVAKGAAGAGAGAAALATGNRSNKLWIIPVLLLAAILGALGLKQCNKDDSGDVATDSEETVVETTVGGETVAETTSEAVVETTVAAVADTTTAAVSDTTASAAGTGTIVDVAKAGGFNTLLAAVEAAGLSDTLKGPGPFTVFAPSDAAFAKLPAGLVDALLKPENKETLVKVLTYHVVPGKVMAADIKPGDVATVETGNITLAVDGANVKVNEALVTKADIAASNGVIHVIDSVLVPAGVDAAALLGGAAPATEAAATDTQPAAAPETNAAGDAVSEDLTVYFDNASAAINADGQAKIDKAAEILKALPDGAVVNLVGHASKTGNAAKNQALSEQRATNVQKALEAKLGGKAITFNKSAKGDSEPVENQDKSRRVTIEIQK